MTDVENREVVALHGTAGNKEILYLQFKSILPVLHNLRYKVIYHEGHRIITNRYHPRVIEMKNLFGVHHVFREYCHTTACCFSCFQSALTKWDETRKGSPSVLCGFSQGALYAVHLAQKRCRDSKLILFCPPFTQEIEESLDLSRPLSNPCLIIAGSTDTIVPRDQVERLMHHFKNAQCIFHDGGHVPNPGDVRVNDAISDFLTTH